MQPTRQAILAYLREHRLATAKELSGWLDRTPANIRHHLDILSDGGLVKVAHEEPGVGKGRPALVFSLTSHTAEHSLDILAKALLTGLSGQSRQERVARLRCVAAALSGTTGGEDISGAPIQRLHHATRRLNDMNYLARWEAHATGPQIIMSNCPYAGILDDHPELCELDGYLVEELTGMQVRHVERFSCLAGGTPYCIFSVGE